MIAKASVGPGRNSFRRMRPRATGRSSPALALSARPPHRRLRADRESLARQIVRDTPRKLGYRMPAEWEPHEATWLAWPHESSDWPGKFAPIPWLYGEIVRLLARVERVRILVEHADAEQQRPPHSQEMPRGSERRRVLPSRHQPQLDSRLCPLFVKNSAGDIAVTDWKFNGWAKYPNYAADDAVPRLSRRSLSFRASNPDWFSKAAAST